MDAKKSKFKFVRLDADDIGSFIELALLNGNIEMAVDIHQRVQNALKRLREELESNKEIQVLMVGCDDILLSIKQDRYDSIYFEKLRKAFSNNSNFTISMGVADTLDGALLNLRKAKLSGKDKIVSG